MSADKSQGRAVWSMAAREEQERNHEKSVDSPSELGKDCAVALPEWYAAFLYLNFSQADSC